MSTISTTKDNHNPAVPGPRRRLAAILFDIDGTLVHSDPIHFAVFQELLLQEEGFNDNRPIDQAFFRQHIAGGSNALIMARLFPTWSVAQQEAWSEHKEARFRERAQQSMKNLKMSGLDKLQTWIDSKGIKKAAVTNAPKLNAKAILQGIDYADWFHNVLILSDDCVRPKPDPAPYLTACERLNVAPHECLVLEDSPSGARAGVAAGAVVMGVLSGQTEKTLLGVGCHMVLQDFDDPKLWQYLESCDLVVANPGDAPLTTMTPAPAPPPPPPPHSS